jgi:hypothetical protein
MNDDELDKRLDELLVALYTMHDDVAMSSRKLSILIDTVGALRSEFSQGAFPDEPR